SSCIALPFASRRGVDPATRPPRSPSLVGRHSARPVSRPACPNCVPASRSVALATMGAAPDLTGALTVASYANLGTLGRRRPGAFVGACRRFRTGLRGDGIPDGTNHPRLGENPDLTVIGPTRGSLRAQRDTP